MTPTFSALKPLEYSLGFTPFLFAQVGTYYEYEDLPPQFKAQDISRNGLMTLNLALSLVAVPLIASLFLRIASARRPNTRSLSKYWKNSLGTYTFYILLFLAYG
jgi:hypothetical protein